MTLTQTDRFPIHGSAAPQFAQVKAEFERNFRERGEGGAACTIYHRGEKVVDLWGGYRCHEQRQPWAEDTLTLTFSVSKGMAAAATVVAHSRGFFELDEPVATYWPEFGCNGKSKITVRQLLNHQAGLVGVDRKLSASELANHETMAEILAGQQPLWTPGREHGYHTLTLGWYQNELIRRTDPQGRSLGEFFQQEIAQPLDVDFYIGLPPELDSKRLSNIRGFHRLSTLVHLHELPALMVLSAIWPWSRVSKSIKTLRIANPADVGGPEYRDVEIPSANGFGESRAIAKIYDVLSRGGHELGIKSSSWRELIAPATAPTRGSYDSVLKINTRYRFGFSRPSNDFRFGIGQRAFGCPGAGGSFGMADPDAEISFCYLTNKMGFRLFDDPREKAVRDACYASLAAFGQHRAAA